MVHIKLVVSKLGNEVFDYSQVSANTGQVEGITVVLEDKVIPVHGISGFTHKQFSNVKNLTTKLRPSMGPVELVSVVRWSLF